MTDTELEDVADQKGREYARKARAQCPEWENTHWAAGDVEIENQMSFADGYKAGFHEGNPMNDETIELYRTVLGRFGIAHQRMKLFEEMGELMNAIAKHTAGRVIDADVITELADVAIMIEQIALFYGHENFLNEKKRKQLRLKERLKGKGGDIE